MKNLLVCGYLLAIAATTPVAACAEAQRFSVETGCPIAITGARLSRDDSIHGTFTGFNLVVTMGGAAKLERGMVPYYGVVRIIMTDRMTRGYPWRFNRVVPDFIDPTQFEDYTIISHLAGNATYPLPSHPAISVRLHCEKVPIGFYTHP